jgi:hypothetical protein
LIGAVAMAASEPLSLPGFSIQTLGGPIAFGPIRRLEGQLQRRPSHHWHRGRRRTRCHQA